MLSDLDIKRLRWRSRRGMLELDLLLLPFFDNKFTDLTDAEKHTFVKLLEQDDPDLLSWFSRNSRPADADLREMVDMILAVHGMA